MLLPMLLLMMMLLSASRTKAPLCGQCGARQLFDAGVLVQTPPALRAAAAQIIASTSSLTRCCPPPPTHPRATPEPQQPHSTHLDEGAGQQEAVCEADLHAAQQRGHAGAVRWQVAEEVHHLGVGGDGRLQHAHKGVAIDGLDGGGLLCVLRGCDGASETGSQPAGCRVLLCSMRLRWVAARARSLRPRCCALREPYAALRDLLLRTLGSPAALMTRERAGRATTPTLRRAAVPSGARTLHFTASAMAAGEVRR
jgi:hypothetical protein